MSSEKRWNPALRKCVWYKNERHRCRLIDRGFVPQSWECLKSQMPYTQYYALLLASRLRPENSALRMDFSFPSKFL